MIVQNERTSKARKYFYPRSNEVFPLFSWCGEFTCKSDFFISRSCSNYIVAIFTIDGEGELTLNGNTFALKKNTIALLLGDEDYHYRPTAEGWQFKFAHLHGEATKVLAREIVSARSNVFPFFDENGAFDEIIDCVINNAEESKASSLVQKLLSCLYFGEQNANEHPLVAQTRKFVLSSLSADLSVDALSRNAGLSRPYFTELFSRLTGKNPSTFVTSERLKKAKELLLTTSLSVAEISSSVGYYDLSSFIRLFKKHEGITPLALRKTKPYL